MLRTMPEDPRLRFLRAVVLERVGEADLAKSERERARALGLPYDTERSLCEHLGLPAPPPPPGPLPTRTVVAPSRSRTKAAARTKPARASPPSRRIPAKRARRR